MRVLRAQHLGMCFGVRDAIALALEHVEAGPLTILGELVHNPAVLSELRARGISVPGDPQDRGYGIVAMVTLPGGLEVQVYQPRHQLAIDVQAQG